MPDEIDDDSDSESLCTECDGEVISQTLQARDMLLELTGEVTKLSMVMSEIPECQIKEVLVRLQSFLSCVEALPIKISAPHWGNNLSSEVQ